MRKNIKKIKYKTTVTMHICTVTVANVLMWSIFEAKYVKFVSFCIMQRFTSADADALRAFLLGVVKKCYFNTLKILLYYFNTSFYNLPYRGRATLFLNHTKFFSSKLKALPAQPNPKSEISNPNQTKQTLQSSPHAFA